MTSLFDAAKAGDYAHAQCQFCSVRDTNSTSTIHSVSLHNREEQKFAHYFSTTAPTSTVKMLMDSPL